MSTAKISRKDGQHAHHFTSAEHEYDTSKHGVWSFLLTEVLMFGGLFVAYAIFYNLYPEVWEAGSRLLDWKMGALNTVVLLISSFTMAMGIYYVQQNDKNKAVLNLAITLVCGGIFMVVKYFEYSGKIEKGMLPGKMFTYSGAEVENLGWFFSVYFCMTGLHGFHVLCGMGLIAWVMIRANRGEFNSKYYTPVEGVGLFWHLVDLIWIYLFPMLYLLGRF